MHACMHVCIYCIAYLSMYCSSKLLTRKKEMNSIQFNSIQFNSIRLTCLVIILVCSADFVVQYSTTAVVACLLAFFVYLVDRMLRYDMICYDDTMLSSISNHLIFYLLYGSKSFRTSSSRVCAIFSKSSRSDESLSLSLLLLLLFKFFFLLFRFRFCFFFRVI